MTTGNGSRQKSYVYVGLAGETGPGRTIKSGLYRRDTDGSEWELLSRGLPEAPAVRAIAAHPQKPGTVFAGTQSGPYVSTDHGDHWEKVNVPDHGFPVWSLLFHPRNPNTILAGYESCEIYRSDDGGNNWSRLPVSVRFPDVTTGPGANLAKRVLMLSGSAADPDELYGAIEVGGVIRSLDGGDHWESVSHGHYVNDDAVDMHGVLCSSFRPDTVLAIARAGLFCSADHGEHWSYIKLGLQNEKGQTYCRYIAEMPGNPRHVWIAGGPAFRSDHGALFHSNDGGQNWQQVDLGVQPQSTMFGVAFDPHQPQQMYCASSGGEVFGSPDGGQTWTAHPLPQGASQVYALACG